MSKENNYNTAKTPGTDPFEKIDEQNKADIHSVLDQMPKGDGVQIEDIKSELDMSQKLGPQIGGHGQVRALNASESVRDDQSMKSSSMLKSMTMKDNRVLPSEPGESQNLMAMDLNQDKDEGVSPPGAEQEVMIGQPVVPQVLHQPIEQQQQMVQQQVVIMPGSQDSGFRVVKQKDADQDQKAVDVAAISYNKQTETKNQLELDQYKVSSTLGFFFKHSYRDVGRKKCHFCLSFCSVLIVVTAALVINTIVEKGPIIFLKLSEGEVGQYDGIVYPQRDMDFDSFQNTKGIFINYTRSMETLNNTGTSYNLSPRKTFCGSKAGSSYPQDRREDSNDPMWWMKEEQEFVMTSDGQNRVPSLSQLNREYGGVKYQYDMCAVFMDTDREREMQSGLKYKFPRLNEGQCIIHRDMAAQLQVNQNDIFFIQMNARKNLQQLAKIYLDRTDTEQIIPTIPKDYEKLNISCRVAAIGDNSYGKLYKREAPTAVFMEYDYVFSQMANYLPQPWDTFPLHQCEKDGKPDFCTFREWLKNNGTEVAQGLADFMMMTLPTPRTDYYQSSDYANIQRGVTDIANKIIDGLGFYPIKVDMPVLGMMQRFSQAILMLGLIFDIIILLFIILSVLLIYSLLMISVEAKTFEFGVMRMTGLSKSGIVTMIVIQAFMFVLPSVIMGFGLSFWFLHMGYSAIFSADMGLDLTPVPSGFAVLQALIIGILIPILSSIVPIQSALKKNLNDSLDLQRSKTQSTNIKILDPNSTDMGSYIVFGSVGIIYGMGIYYFLPLAMLSFNFALVLQIFFAILIGMLYGLSLLAFNLQRFMEILLVYLFLFWEKSSMKKMIFMNLTAHKMRNKMTSIIFSISIGFIIFLVVIYRLQIQSTKLLQMQSAGAYFVVNGAKQKYLTPQLMDPILKLHARHISEFGYLTTNLQNDPYYDIKETLGSDKARAISDDINIHGVQPTIFNTLINDFFDIGFQTDSGLSLGDQLYSKRGSQSGATGQVLVQQSNYDVKDRNQYMLLSMKGQGYNARNKFYKKRVVWTANNAPFFNMKDREQQAGTQNFLVNIPQFSFFTGPYKSINETRYGNIFIQFAYEAGSDEYKTAAKNFIKDCKETFSSDEANNIWFENQFDEDDTMDTVVLILDFIFSAIIVITMLLCLFSLASSMSANLLDQTKEIGILRAMGFTKTRIKMLYFYEAFILVIASSLLGVMIGCTVAFTMVLQQVVFTQIPIFFFFPWMQFGIIMVMSLMCAIISSWGPTSNLVKHDIAFIFRSGA